MATCLDLLLCWVTRVYNIPLIKPDMVLPPRQEMAKTKVQLSENITAQRTAISRVSLRNFKGHVDQKIDMGKITVLIGPTSSGKSTVLQAVHLFNAALGSDGRVLRARHIQGHGKFTDIVTDRDGERQVAIGVDGHKRVKVGGEQVVSTKFSCSVEFNGSQHPPGLNAVVDMRCDSPPVDPCSMRLEHLYGTGKTIISGAVAPGASPISVQADGGLALRVQADLAECPMTKAFRTMFCNGEYFRTLLGNLWHVPFSRVVTSDELQLDYSTSIMSQNREQAAASLFSHISSDTSIQKKISDMVEMVGFKQIATRTIPVQRGKKNLLTMDFLTNRSHNTILHEGSGLNQLATMFAILAYSPKGSIVTIEEPEIHLDPAAQARLMKIMVNQAIEEDKQIVFTTHSDHLLYPLLAYVKKEDCPLACDDVFMHYFDTDESGGIAGAERLNINEHGQIEGGLRGFWDADMKAMGEVLG